MSKDTGIDYRPALTSFSFFRSSNPDEPLNDFRILKEDDEIGIRFALNGMKSIRELKDDGFQPALLVIVYDRIKSVGFDLISYGSTDFDDIDVHSQFVEFKFPLFKYRKSNREYDLQKIYRGLKVVLLIEGYSDDILDDEFMIPLINESNINEIFATKIPIKV